MKEKKQRESDHEANNFASLPGEVNSPNKSIIRAIKGRSLIASTGVPLPRNSRFCAGIEARVGVPCGASSGITCLVKVIHLRPVSDR